MLDSMYEVFASKRLGLLRQIQALTTGQDPEKYSATWRLYNFPEEKASLGAEDGSLNHRKYQNFVLYAVNAVALVYNGRIEEVKHSDINILHPCKYVEERLKLYRAIFEFKTAIEAIDDVDYFLIDGSLISDLITTTDLDRWLSNEEKDEVMDLIPEIEESGAVGISAQRFAERFKDEKKYEKIAFLEYIEYLLALGRLIEKGMDKLVGISKTSVGTDYFHEGLPDIAVFENEVKDTGFSAPLYIPLASKIMRRFPVYEEFFRSLIFTVFYARIEAKKGVFMLEIPREIGEDEVFEILCRIKGNCIAGYPYLLRKAHRMAVITSKDIQRVSSSLGITAKTGREML